MEKLVMRARARAAARAAGLFDIARRVRPESGPGWADWRARAAAAGRLRPANAPSMPIDEAKARAACAPMGVLETIVQAADAQGRSRALYVIVPDQSLRAHYEQLGLAIEPGCRVLLDAAALLPIAVLRLSAAGAASTAAGTGSAPAPRGSAPPE